MKRIVAAVLIAGWIASVASAQPGATDVDVTTNVGSSQQQNVSVVGGGRSNSDSRSMAGAVSGGSTSAVSINTSSETNYRNKTHPLPTMFPYLPLWQHGGWGTVKGYFANGPSNDNAIYERSFDSRDPEDIREVKGILSAIPYKGPIQTVGGFWKGVLTAFGAPDQFHHGRGFEISNSVDRIRRPQAQPMMVFTDSDIDTRVLEKAGYSYVGKISIEGNHNRNWDQVYNAAIAEALPWHVDILLVSGGMKGITVGSTTSASGGGGYSQLHYSLSLFGGSSKGVTEGKGKPVLGAAAYRFSPRMSHKRSLPRLFYQRLQLKYGVDEKPQPVSYVNPTGGRPGIQMSNEVYQMAGFSEDQRVDYVSVTQRPAGR
jgi:hypothetical protein